MRLLHLADLHLERAFASLGCYGDTARRRREGLREALRRAGGEALRHGCDVLTLGGDIVEADRAGPETARFLADLFASWRPLRVAVAPGNHDAVTPGSIWASAAWPDNVHVFREASLAPLPLGEGVVLWGLGHREPGWMGDPLDVEPVGGGGVHIALFHGAELGSRPHGKSIHGPFRAADIAARGFAVALCGHYHRRRVDLAARLVYPGSPEPLTFEEEGPRGPVLVTVGTRGRIEVEGLTTNRWHALQADADLEGAPSGAAVLDRIRAVVRSATGPLPPDRTMLRLTLRGDLPQEVGVDVTAVEAAATEAAGLAVVRIRDLTRPAVDPRAVAGDRTARGVFARGLLDAIRLAADDADRAVLEDALRYGLQALSGVEVSLREAPAVGAAPPAGDGDHEARGAARVGLEAAP